MIHFPPELLMQVNLRVPQRAGGFPTARPSCTCSGNGRRWPERAGEYGLSAPICSLSPCQIAFHVMEWSKTASVFPSHRLFWRFPGRGKSAAVCFDVSRAAESPPPFVLTFPGPRNLTHVMFWRFPSRGILQMFCFDVFRASEFYKCFVLTSSEPQFSVSANGVGRRSVKNHAAPLHLMIANNRK